MTKRATTQAAWRTASGCTGKQLFTSLALAREVAHRTSKAHSGAVQPYRCAVCDGWHVGNKNKIR